MDGINLDILNAQLRQLQANQRRGVTVADGGYTGRLVAMKPTTDKRGRQLQIAVFEITEGAFAGQKIETPVWGNAERLVTAPVRAGTLFSVRVYTHRDDNGREYGRVNVEAIRAIEATVTSPADECIAAPEPIDRDALTAAATEFTRCFRCVGSISTRRQIVDWLRSYGGMARCEPGWYVGDVVYLSTFVYTEAIAEHQAKNDLDAEACGEPKKGSPEDFNGPCFAHFLTFDTDCRDAEGEPNPAGCQSSATAIVAALLELGIPPNLIWPFYSGSKGFHVQIPSMCAATVPSDDYHLVAKAFCKFIAERAGVTIDESLYRKLQPLRAPNSRHNETGLYKVWLSLDELIELPFENLRNLATQPRAFEPPACVCEPVPELVSLWQQASRVVRTARFPVGSSSVGEAVSSISGATWEYLLNGAVPGSRAESHFKAAANLADFGSVDELVHALLRRPATLSGLPAREAESHVESALRRAAMRHRPGEGAAG